MSIIIIQVITNSMRLLVARATHILRIIIYYIIIVNYITVIMRIIVVVALIILIVVANLVIYTCIIVGVMINVRILDVRRFIIGFVRLLILKGLNGCNHHKEILIRNY